MQTKQEKRLELKRVLATPSRGDAHKLNVTNAKVWENEYQRDNNDDDDNYNYYNEEYCEADAVARNADDE